VFQNNEQRAVVQASSLLKARSGRCASHRSLPLCDVRFRKRLQSIGVSVTDTTPEIRIAAQIVTANSRNKRPSTPPMNRTGMNTAASESVIETIVNPISRDPTSDAAS